MSDLTIYQELRTRYKTGTSMPSTEYPNEAFKKPGPESNTPAAIWARFNILIGEERRMDIGDPVARYRTVGS